MQKRQKRLTEIKFLHLQNQINHKYPNLVRTQVEIISDPNYLMRKKLVKLGSW